MKLTERIESFSELGEILRGSIEGKNTAYTSDLEKLINVQQYKNPWFTPENVRMSIKAIAQELTHDNLTRWTGSYPALDSAGGNANVGVVMAGNIPLAGFHDLLSVLITGNNIVAKTSTKDSDLIVFLGEALKHINPGFRQMIKFTEGVLENFDTIIATGSDNSSRYFEYYFGKHPHIIRKNRNSIAIIDGSETNSELENLGTDIFSYFGLGCRNVSKIYIPEKYDIKDMTPAWTLYSDIVYHNKYANNYDYVKALSIVGKEKFIDTGYLIIKENSGLSSPVSVLYYEYYNHPDEIRNKTDLIKDKIQCQVGRNFIPFGHAQSPHLWDYADEIDTIEFLLKKNSPAIL